MYCSTNRHGKRLSGPVWAWIAFQAISQVAFQGVFHTSLNKFAVAHWDVSLSALVLLVSFAGYATAARGQKRQWRTRGLWLVLSAGNALGAFGLLHLLWRLAHHLPA